MGEKAQTVLAEKPPSRSIPTTMRAAAIDRFGSPDRLSIHEVPVPEIDPNEVLIAVHTAGVGPWDAEMREGCVSGPVNFPLILGTDGSGIVAAVGPRVRRLKVGERVYSYSYENPKGGFYAEYVAVDSQKVAPAPATLTLEEAGAIATTGLTAVQGIDDHLHVTKSESVVIHGAGGGVGSLAVQFAKLRKARVLATASTERGIDFVRTLGADLVVNGHDEDLADVILRWAPDGADALLALAGGPSLDLGIGAVRDGGRVAYPNGVEPPPKRRRGIKIQAYDAVPGVREFEHLTKAVEASRLRIPIAARFPLEEAARAHQQIARGHTLGKIVLRIREDG
jgi:NADPH:quinone reductase-like Zn-dependent oxidoreductase